MRAQRGENEGEGKKERRREGEREHASRILIKG